MPAVDSSFVILPRFTTLVGATTFTTLPMDVSSYGGAQFQIWRSPFRSKAGSSPPPTFTMFLEESLDAQEWVLGPETSQSFVVAQVDRKFFAYDFRLRWFRLRIVLTGVEPIVTCWAEGLLRGGGGGMWPDLGINAGPAGFVNVGRDAAMGGGWSGPGSYSYEATQAWIAQQMANDPYGQLAAAFHQPTYGKPGSSPSSVTYKKK